jgi:hypothetical protein
MAVTALFQKRNRMTALDEAIRLLEISGEGTKQKAFEREI